MSYPWQQAVWPIGVNQEIRYEHFEDLRRYIYIKRYRDDISYDYDSPITEDTWETWVDATFSAPDFPLDIGGANFGSLLNIVFQGDNMDADLYSCYNCNFADAAALKAQPPVINGTFNSGIWRIVADVSRYRDFDENSGRRIVSHYTAGTGETFLSDAFAYRWLPKQVGPDDQKKLVQYDDTGRKIPDKSWLELNWQYMTQPMTLGPTFDIVGGETGGGTYRQEKVPYSALGDALLNLTGMQYGAWEPDAGQGNAGMPAGTLPNYWAETNQLQFDPKLCYAYQNQVELALSHSGWEVEITEGTPHGDEYILNYEAKTGLDYKLRGPKWASMDDELWGCNGSAVELALWLIESYDWYFCTIKKFWPEAIMELRYEMVKTGLYTSQEVEAEYPTPSGNWRRTWRYTFGRPKDNLIMEPGSFVPTKYRYEDYGTSSQYWPGVFTPKEQTPDIIDPIQEVKDRHDTLPTDDRQYYECMRTMLNDMWAVLERSNMHFVNANVSLHYKVFENADAHTGFSSSRQAYQAASDDAMAVYGATDWTGFTPIAGAGGLNIGKVARSSWIAGTSSWTGICTVRAGLVQIVPGGNWDGVFLKSDWIYLKLVVKPGIKTGNTEPNNATTLQDVIFEIGTEGYTLTVPTFDTTYWYVNRPSTGVPDPVPQEWLDWGGTAAYPFSTYGKRMFIPVNLDLIEWTGSAWRIPITWLSPLPPMDVYSSPITSGHAQGQINFSEADESSEGLGYIITPNVELNMEEHHLDYTQIAVDDLKFDDNGNLI